MGLAQRIFLQAIAAVGAPMESHYRDALVDSFQAVANVATQLLEENAFLKGRLVERPPTSEHTHNSYASMLKKGLNNTGVPNTDEQPEQLRTEVESDLDAQYQSLDREEEELMDYEGPKGKKRTKPKKKTPKISTSEEEDARASPEPSSKKSKQTADGKGQTPSKASNNQKESNTATPNPTPQEATMRELMERPTEGPRSYLAVASATSSCGVSSGGTGGAAGPTRVDVLRSPAPIQKPALLIYPTHPKPNSEYSQVVEALRAEVSPEELGLSEFETRRIKGGALISSTSVETADGGRRIGGRGAWATKLVSQKR
ncbi:hypothetical protein HPB47_014328 [Ixodes persulcatus]|uniref:Uncharacterized protein n=1 Tax=Ixodes persulcatus TaxID=34615 RepID=A0AC60QX47_IXOPE|nr:hypothetical protein HPB47_014328 [Ixodes persulcatus]